MSLKKVHNKQPENFKFTDKNLKNMSEILKRYPNKNKKSAVMPLLYLAQKQNENWIVKTNSGTIFSTPNVIIAGGVGSFEPRKFPVKDCEKFENKSVFYSIKDKKIFEGKNVTIFGGGDSALDWAVELSKNSKVNLIHRRDDFRGHKRL